ncbi:MAG: MATE family efflux transporter [Bacteroidales bacterium]|nr:MATE family efflux transporter [Bacteroidales bacterium]
MFDNRDSIDFGREPIGKLFRRMFLPTLVSMVSMVVLNITDGAFVGHGAGSDALAAVNIAAPLFMIMAGIGLAFGIGSNVAASIHQAKGNNKAADINLTQGILASTTIGLLLGILIYTHQEEVCWLFGCSERLLPQACSYVKWMAVLMPFNLFGMTAMFMVRLDGSPRFAMAVNCGMALSNIILDYILIYPMQMGLEGAAIATCISFSAGNIPVLYYLLFKSRQVHFHWIKVSRTSIRLTARNLAYQLRIGASALLGEAALAAVIIVGNYVFIHYLGEDGVAAFSVGCYCLPIAFMMGNAIVQSIQPIISYAHGAGNTTRLQQSSRLAIRTALLSGIAGMLLLCLFADQISRTFIDTESAAYPLCCEGLPWFSIAFLFVAVNMTMIGIMQSTEKAIRAAVFTILRGFVLSLSCFVLLPMWLGDVGLWLALPLAEGTTAALMSAIDN